MKKLSLLVIAVLFLSAGLSAQTIFAKGDKVASFGFGLGSNLNDWAGLKVVLPPIAASFEYGIVDGLINGNASIGVGGTLAYARSKGKHDSDLKANSFVIGAKGSFHYQFVDKLDTYGGLMLGFKLEKAEYGSWDDDNNELALSIYVGARYYFTENFAAYGELGYGIAVLQLGVAYKF